MQGSPALTRRSNDSKEIVDFEGPFCPNPPYDSTISFKARPRRRPVEVAHAPQSRDVFTESGDRVLEAVQRRNVRRITRLLRNIRRTLVSVTAYVSALDLFTIGIGPSSSHTVGPMRAARAFADFLADEGLLDSVGRVRCTLYGSLGSTGIGHGTPDAVIAGLAGASPETCEPEHVRGSWTRLPGRSNATMPVVRLSRISASRGMTSAADAGRAESDPSASSGNAGRSKDADRAEDADRTENGRVLLNGTHPIEMEQGDIVFEPRTRLPGHPNALTLAAWNAHDAAPIAERTYYSIGGGFIKRDGETSRLGANAAHPYPFATSGHLLELCDENGLTIDQIALGNEVALHGEDAIRSGLDAIWDAMADSVVAGLGGDGILPGGLGVKRRAAAVRNQLEACAADPGRDTSIEWLHAFALAVNEENASGGRVVTAPTNGAAGIIPAVGHYYLRFVPGASLEGIHRYLLTATAIGSLFKANASISGAEAGCQGEVGSACAMAAGGLCAVLGGTTRQVENAAEIAMEHHLGLTCDPVGGLVQVPCIERNAIASSTAVSAARLALHGDGTHLVSLDTVIETMRRTGLDMSTKYKETSEGGLAVSVPDC
ncbi:MAG: L-serine ammonia-lyase [Microbacteriaceae bacterium]|nr:MAG: L-serine ammonia-lyase [Microbacteriaceae bacterium]